MDKKVETLKPELVLNIKAISEKNRELNGEPLYYTGIAKRYGVSGQTAYLWQDKMPKVVSVIKQIMDDFGMTFDEVISDFKPKEKRKMKKITKKDKD